MAQMTMGDLVNSKPRDNLTRLIELVADAANMSQDDDEFYIHAQTTDVRVPKEVMKRILDVSFEANAICLEISELFELRDEE